MCLPKAPKVKPVTTGTQQNIIEQAPTDDVAKPTDVQTALADELRTRSRKGIASLRTTKATSGLSIPGA